MGDTGSLKLRRHPNKCNTVNRIVSLFEIPRPKKRGLQRTNSLPATRLPVSLLDEDEQTNTHIPFNGKYNGVGRVQRIKEEIEQKSKAEEHNKPNSYGRKKRRNKKRNCDSEGNIDDVTEDDKKKIVQNLIYINDRVGKIEVVTEQIQNSDTELEITFTNEISNDNIFKNLKKQKEKIEVRDKVNDEDSDVIESRLSCDTVVNRLNSESSIDDLEPNIEHPKAGYGNYDVGSGVVFFSKSTSSEGEGDDRVSQESNTAVKDDLSSDHLFEENDDQRSEAEKASPLFWNPYKRSEGIKNNNSDDDSIYQELGDNEETTKDINNSNDDSFVWCTKQNENTDEYYKETYKGTDDNKKTDKDISNSEVDSISWWINKPFIQVHNNVSLKHTNQSDNLPEEIKESASKYSQSPTNTLEKGGRFIKNQARTSMRSNRRRAGVLLTSGTVKDLARRFEGFKDAAEKGETEYYRRSFIDEMDKELENMKNDGFNDDLHQSFENLSVLGYDNDNDVTELVASSDEETSSLSQTLMRFSNSQENQGYTDNTDDDLFGETLFSEDIEHGFYYVETYNADGKELIMCSIQIDRQSVDFNKFDEVKSQSESRLLAQQDDEKTLILMEGVAGSNHRLSLGESNLGSDSKRTTIYSTTSGDSYEERLTDDEGIDIETSSSSYGYSAARRETYCDDQGIVRIERVAPYRQNVEHHPEYMETTNHYYTIDPKDEEEENYYDTIQSEREMTVSVPEVKKETLQYIVEEIKSTERKFVDDMKGVLQQYKPFLEERCPDKVGVVFGNMENIYLKQIEFLETLDNSEDEIKDVVQAFIDFEDLFKLYPRYFKNTPKANSAVKDLAEVIKEKQEQLNDKLHLSAYLLTPLQRLGKYKLFLENITKQLKKENKSTGAVQMALEIIKKYMSKGNDAVAVASILHSPLHFKDYGSFVTREKFTLIKPKRMELMVFLFQDVVVLTTEDQRNMEQFIYYQSIKTEDMRIATFDDTTIHLTDYTKTKRRTTTKHTFVLDAKTQKLKNSWKTEIEEILWKQLKKVKENTIKEYQSGKKAPKKLGRNRMKSSGSSVFYVE